MFRLTADAFQAEMPELQGLSFSGRLSAYAEFTREQAERCLQNESAEHSLQRGSGGRCRQCGGTPEEVKSRLYENSYAFGRKLRKDLHIKTWKESVEALKTIYAMIGIDFRYNGQGGSKAGQGESAPGPDEDTIGPDGFEIRRCFFSSCYTEEVCRLISSLDEGLAAGLSGGGKLSFTQRITDGGSCCKGYLTFS